MSFFKKLPFEIYLSIIWVISILLVNPLGDFPLNDDWAYGKSVWNLYEHGNLSIGDWPAMTLIGQVLPGAFISYLFGFSFTLLRFYTLLVSLVGGIVFYKLAKRLSSNKNLVVFTSLLFFYHPLYFSLSFTFMTDVHFLTTMLLSIFLFYEYLIKRRISFFILATIFSVASTMIRQPGVIVPLGFALTALFSKRNLLSKIYCWIPFIITLFSLFLHSTWLSQSAESSRNVVEFSDLINLLFSINLYDILTRIINSILFVGLFSFPLIILFFKEIRCIYKAKKKTFLIISIVTIALLLIGGVHFPIGNTFYNFGLGPKLLKDGYWNVNITPHINNGIWSILLKTISIATCLGIVHLLLQKGYIRNKTNQKLKFLYNSPPKFFILLTLIGYISLLAISSSFFDRYTIPIFALVLLLLLSTKITFTKVSTLPAIACLVLVAFFSISATHDYLSWNRARWDSLEYLEENRKVDHLKIDGGFEFNSWYNTGPYSDASGIEDKSWWFVNKDEYVIAFGDIKGFQKIKGFYYSQILSCKKDSIYILHRR